MALEAFMNNYANYVNAAEYAKDWANQIIDLVPKMQADPNFLTALTAQEQAQMAANLTAAQQMGIVPIAPSVLPPNPIVD